MGLKLFRESPIFPLPHDYADLTSDGQRMARVNASALWQYPTSDPDLKMLCRTASTRFFDLWYLHADVEQDFDPQFYDEVPCPSPDFHYALLSEWTLHDLCIATAPRGSAKTNLKRKVQIQDMLTRPTNSFVYATSSNDNAVGTGIACKQQLYYNERIQADFGRMKPARGVKPTGDKFFYLENGSWLRCMSVESKMRGIRPRWFHLDDPEFDEKKSTDVSMLRDYMQRLLFKLVMPMVMRGNTGVRWTNTFVSKRHYAWQAMLVDERGMARDPRFNFWNRFFVQALYHGPNGEAISAWPHMWPVDNEERIRLKVPNRRTLVEIREGLGEAVFQSEYQGRPGDVEGRKFPTFDESDAIDRWGYSIEGDEIRWGSTTRSLAEVLREGRLAITADTSDTHGPTSDYKAAACLLHLPMTNELFVLDLFCKRCPESELEAAIFTFAERWKVPLLCPEKEKGSKNLIASILNKLRTRASTLKGLSFVPALRPITPTGDKTKRIDSSLSYRFEHNKIRLPVHLRNKAPWNELFREIGAFNADAPNGGIDHDDALDVVAMGESVVGWKATPTGTDDVVESTVMDLIERNEQVEGLGNLSRMVDITTLPLERVLKFLGEQRPKDAVNLI